MNLFATVLTYPAPAANYRGESEQNRTVIQKITDDRLEYPIISRKRCETHSEKSWQVMTFPVTGPDCMTKNS